MASNTYNLNTWAAKRIIGDNSSASPESALLHNGGGRGNTAAGDTWIFYDDASGSGTPWGIKHDQVSDKISLFGNGTNTSWISLGTGNIYTDGKIGIGYDPGTNGNTYKLYVNGTSYFNNTITSTGNIYISNTAPHLYLQNTNWTKGTTPGANYYSALEFHTSGDYASNKRVGLLEVNIDTSNNVWMNIWTVPNVSGNTSWSGIRMKRAADEALTIYHAGDTEITGCLSIFPTIGNYREGIRIHSYSSWSDITLCGNDNTGNSGISANSWFIGNNNGNFHITRNGSSGNGSAYLRCVSNVWAWNGTATGDISGNAGTATQLSNTPNTTSTFLRGDNTWTNELLGPLKIGTSDAAANTGYASANVGSQNYIAFYGVYGDNPGGYNHTYIGESIYGSKTAANEQSELLLFHGNDPAASSGPDRIRLFAGQVDICVYTSALSGTWDTIRANAGTKVANFANGVMTVTGNILPEANGTRALGSSTYEWGTTCTRAIYARHFDASQNYTSNLDMYYGYNRASNHYFYTMDGTTRTHRATISATGLYINQPAGNRNAGIIGQYDSTKAALIWAMGSSYNIKADGTTLGSLYGAAYAHTNATGALGSRTLAGGHQFLWCQNGGVNVALGNNIWTNGSLYINGANHGIYYEGSKATYRMIRFLDNTGDAYGNGISIGGGGLTILGSGESADTIVSNVTNAGGTETTYIAADGNIEFYPGQNSYDATARIWMTAGVLNIGTDGNTTRENSINVYSGAGRIQLFSAAATNGSRGLWVAAHGTGAAKTVVAIDTNNNATFNGNAATATKATQDGSGNVITSTYLKLSGGTMTGTLTLKANQYFYDNVSGINANNSDIIGINCLKFGDAADTFREGIMFPNGTSYDCLAANGGKFYIRTGTDGTPAVNATNANGTLIASAIWGNKVLINSNWVGFYAAIGDSTTRYGYVQANENRMYFRKENGVSSYGFDFNSHLYTTGHYYASNAGACLLLACSDLTNVKDAKNGLSANREQGMACYSKDYGSWMGDFKQGYTQSNGQIWSRIYLRNYKTDGTQVNNYIYLYANKDGTTSYTVANAAAFRSAIGAGTSSLTIGTTATTAAAGNHTHTISQVSWAGGQNLACTLSANNQEFSVDINGNQTGGYWHVWSGKNSKSILVCYNDNMGVSIPSGALTVGSRNVTTAPSSLTYINRIIITPYYHTGGPWEIRSGDDSSNSYLALDYGSSYSQLLTVRHNGLIGMPWGELDLGAWVKNTARSSQSRLNVASGSGIIQLYANGATGGNRGCWVTNAGGTGNHVFYIDQSNRTTFWGKIPRAVGGRATGTSTTIDISSWCPAVGQANPACYSFLVQASNWVALSNLGSLYLISGIQRGGSYGSAIQICKGANGPTVTFNNANGKITITWYNGDGGWYSVMPIYSYE